MSGTAVTGLAAAERGHGTIGWGAVGVAIASFVVITKATWDGFDSDTLARLAGTSAVALVTTLLGTTQLVVHRGELPWVVLVTWSALVLAATTTSIGIWQDHSSDGLWKTAGSCWIVGLVGWLLLPVLQRSWPQRHRRASRGSSRRST